MWNFRRVDRAAAVCVDALGVTQSIQKPRFDPRLQLAQSGRIRGEVAHPNMKIPEIDNPLESESILAIAVFAALADAQKCDLERASLEDLARKLGLPDARQAAKQVFLGKTSLARAIASLNGIEQKQIAYEVAMAVCRVSGDISPGERAFLDELKSRLGLASPAGEAVEHEVRDVVAEPLSKAESAPFLSGETNNGPMILRYSVLNGALELLPESMATMAIIPLQMKMVYRIGCTHGVHLDTGHIREFLATAGIGMGSQMLEGFARKLFGRLGKSVGGKLAGRVANQAAGSAMSFASTYAIGHLADRYYAGGRRLDAASMKSMFAPLRQKALELHSEHLPEIQERARNLDAASLINLVRGNDQP